jgi:hypothetical protein
LTIHQPIDNRINNDDIMRIGVMLEPIKHLGAHNHAAPWWRSRARLAQSPSPPSNLPSITEPGFHAHSLTQSLTKSCHAHNSTRHANLPDAGLTAHSTLRPTLIPRINDFCSTLLV